MGSKRKRVARVLLLVYFFGLLLLWFKASDIAGTRDIIAYSREGGVMLQYLSQLAYFIRLR